MSTTFASLNIRNYRIWFFGALVANVGTWMQRIAQDWLVLTELTDHDGFAVGVVTGLQFAPAVVLTPIAGILADRFDPRKILIVTQALLGVLAAVLGALVLSGHAELWHVYALALGLGVVSALDAPARQVFVSELVPAERLGNAVSLNSASFNAARLIGPGIAGLAIAAVGTGWVFLINAASFAFTIAAMLAMRPAELEKIPRAPRAPGALRAGVRYVRGRSDIVVILIVLFVVAAFGLNFQLTSAVMATEVFHRDADGYGILGSILAIGSLAGALLSARRVRPRVRLVVGAAFGFGVSSALMALAPTYVLFAIATIPVGFFSLTMITSANAAIQLSTDPEMRGRVMSLYVLVLFGATPIGSPIVGWVAETWGGRWSILVGAISTIAVAVAAAAWSRRRWGIEVTYERRPRPHLVLTHPEERAAREQAQIDVAADESGTRTAA
ncbi:MFS transporter [Pseudactinotalea terrae]|uniref:MFS transporter n=1 Tax=Pseudactinotalea terrae TaxID=1743262 RepID=UPI0012E2B6CE|nr:MFS transporter [Pseudactinotalea terrae]